MGQSLQHKADVLTTYLCECMYPYTRKFVCIYTHISMCVYIYIYTHTTYTRTWDRLSRLWAKFCSTRRMFQPHIHACIYVNACIRTYVNSCVYTQISMCVYIYTHTHTNKHTRVRGIGSRNRGSTFATRCGCITFR